MIIETKATPFALTNPGANVTLGAFAARNPTHTAPGGDGFIECGGLYGSISPQWIELAFFGVGADLSTLSANVYGWSSLGDPSSPVDLWVPVLLAGFTAITLAAAKPGVNGTLVPATSFFAQAITLSIGTPASGSDVAVVSPGAGYIAYARVFAAGYQFIEVGFAVGTATSANAIYRKV